MKRGLGGGGGGEKNLLHRYAINIERDLEKFFGCQLLYVISVQGGVSGAIPASAWGQKAQQLCESAKLS